MARSEDTYIDRFGAQPNDPKLHFELMNFIKYMGDKNVKTKKEQQMQTEKYRSSIESRVASSLVSNEEH